MKSKYILLFYAFLFIVLLGLQFHERRSPIYSTRCDEQKFHTRVLAHLKDRVWVHLPYQQRSQIMKRYDFLQIKVLDIETYTIATSRSPRLDCIATLKMSPHLPSKQQSFTHLFQQHQTHWQPETQTTTIGFIIHANTGVEIKDFPKLTDTAKLPAQILMEWNPPPPPPQPSFPPPPKSMTMTEEEFNALIPKEQMAVLSTEINYLFNKLTPAESQKWFNYYKDKDYNNNRQLLSHRCQVDLKCMVKKLQEQKHILQSIKNKN